MHFDWFLHHSAVVSEISPDTQVPCELDQKSQVNTPFKKGGVAVILFVPELLFWQFLQGLLATPQSVACILKSISVFHAVALKMAHRWPSVPPPYAFLFLCFICSALPLAQKHGLHFVHFLKLSGGLGNLPQCLIVMCLSPVSCPDLLPASSMIFSSYTTWLWSRRSTEASSSSSLTPLCYFWDFHSS